MVRRESEDIAMAETDGDGVEQRRDARYMYMTCTASAKASANVRYCMLAPQIVVVRTQSLTVIELFDRRETEARISRGILAILMARTK